MSGNDYRSIRNSKIYEEEIWLFKNVNNYHNYFKTIDYDGKQIRF